MRIRVPFLPLLVLSAVGAAPSISIAAPASETLTPETEVPALVKRDMVEARRFLLGHALVPDVRFTLDPGATPWSVIRQDPSPRTVVSAGTRVMVEVAIPEESPEEVRLPGVYGLEEAEAVALLRSIGLEVAVDHVPSRFPLGRAFAASSEAGARLRRGERVAIRAASLTPPGWEYEPIRVPDYRREKAYEAIGRLISLGLAPQWRWRDAPDAPTGSVLEQDPAPGTLLPPGAPVTLVEPRLSRVPDVVGRPLRDARDDLAAAHLTAALFGPAPEDAVVRETVPPAGRWASYGGRIRVRAEAVAASPTMPAPSATPDATVVPDLGGRSRWDAELLLTGAGLFADVEGDSVDDAARVDRQHPESGARAIRGDHVRVHLLAPDSPPPPSGASGGVGDEAPLPPVPLPPPPEPAASASGPLPAEAGAGDPAATSRVPDVVGMPRIAAQLLLVGAGFWPRTDGSGRPSSRVTSAWYSINARALSPRLRAISPSV